MGLGGLGGCVAVEDGQGGRQKGARGGAHVNTSWSCDHTLSGGRSQNDRGQGRCESGTCKRNNDILKSQ